MSIDKLFEKKLAEHSFPPSPRAWENLETQLSKKNKPLLWLRWAAVFLLGGLLVSLLLIQRKETNLPVAVQPPLQPADIETKAEPAPSEKEKVSVGPKKKNTIPASVPAQPLVAMQELDNEEGPEGVAQLPETNNPQPLEKHQPEESQRSIVLVYTLDPVGEPTTEHAAEETLTADQKDKSFRKMIKLANEVKNSESPLAGIRDMKEELFALDLRKKTTTKKH